MQILSLAWAHSHAFIEHVGNFDPLLSRTFSCHFVNKGEKQAPDLKMSLRPLSEEEGEPAAPPPAIMSIDFSTEKPPSGAAASSAAKIHARRDGSVSSTDGEGGLIQMVEIIKTAVRSVRC